MLFVIGDRRASAVHGLSAAPTPFRLTIPPGDHHDAAGTALAVVKARLGNTCMSRPFCCPFFAPTTFGPHRGLSGRSHSLTSTVVAENGNHRPRHARDDDGPAEGRLGRRLGE